MYVCVTQPNSRAFLHMLSSKPLGLTDQETKIKWPLYFFKGAIFRLLYNLFTVFLKQLGTSNLSYVTAFMSSTFEEIKNFWLRIEEVLLFQAWAFSGSRGANGLCMCIIPPPLTPDPRDAGLRGLGGDEGDRLLARDNSLRSGTCPHGRPAFSVPLSSSKTTQHFSAHFYYF